jgi:hypothetical protein
MQPLQTLRQETILGEAAIRLRKYKGISAYERYDRPLLVLVAKSDIWGPLLDVDTLSEPIVTAPEGHGHVAALDVARITAVSARLRTLLQEIAPEIVTAAEDFCYDVTYIPVSALGHSPQQHPEQPGLLIRPRDIRPRWVTVPVLYAFARWHRGLVHSRGPTA